MASPDDNEHNVLEALDASADELVSLTSDLVRIPSENTPPTGGERDAQEFIARWLGEIGVQVVMRLDINKVLSSNEIAAVTEASNQG